MASQIRSLQLTSKSLSPLNSRRYLSQSRVSYNSRYGRTGELWRSSQPSPSPDSKGSSLTSQSFHNAAIEPTSVNKVFPPIFSKPKTDDRSPRQSSVTRPLQDRTSLELINSYLVFQACRIPGLTAIAEPVISLAESVWMSNIVFSVVKGTFFTHFCGGENIEEVRPTMEKFAAQNVGTILDFALEADIEVDELQGEKALHHASKIKDLLINSVDVASSQPDSFLAVKATAFVPPALLQRWSNTLRLVKEHFIEIVGHHDGFLQEADFVKMVMKLCSMPESQNNLALTQMAKKLFNMGIQKANNEKQGVDFIGVTDLFSFGNKETREIVKEILQVACLPQENVAESEESWHYMNDVVIPNDFKTIDLVIPELHTLISYAKQKGVNIMIDAEQTYFQAAIDDIALSLCRSFNPSLESKSIVEGKLNTPVIFNTYQMYLSDAYKRLEIDLARAERGGYSFGVKVVRGAYMESERKRAKEFGYPDPINPDIETTHTHYNNAINLMIAKVSKYITPKGSAKLPSETETETVPLSFVVASHNNQSIEHTREVLNQTTAEGETVSTSGQHLVSFANLKGMKDGASFNLSSNGYKAYKYIPYGPIKVAIPYLLRRAQENASMLDGKTGGEDRKTISDELWKRIVG